MRDSRIIGGPISEYNAEYCKPLVIDSVRLVCGSDESTKPLCPEIDSESTYKSEITDLLS